MANITYEESAALMTDPTFRGRVKVSCLHFADYILGEAASTPAHNTRVRWAQQCYISPETVAQQTQSPTVMEPAVQTQGAAIPDDQLQTAVETAVNKMI